MIALYYSMACVEYSIAILLLFGIREARVLGRVNLGVNRLLADWLVLCEYRCVLARTRLSEIPCLLTRVISNTQEKQKIYSGVRPTQAPAGAARPGREIGENSNRALYSILYS